MITTLTLVACWSSRAPEPAHPLIMNSQPQATKAAGLEGAYLCSISIPDGGTERYEYPKFHCTITRDAGHLVLAKHAGSQRFRGEIVAMTDGTGFTFDGQFYCPYGECDSPLHGVFKDDGKGQLVGTFSDDKLEVRMVRDPNGAFGGGTYGGRAYGGAQYGGGSYGGYGYGGRHRRHRRP